jgi:hypothetical protein
MEVLTLTTSYLRKRFEGRYTKKEDGHWIANDTKAVELNKNNRRTTRSIRHGLFMINYSQDIGENERCLSVCAEEDCVNPEHNVVVVKDLKIGCWNDNLCKAFEVFLLRRSTMNSNGCQEWKAAKSHTYGEVSFGNIDTDSTHRMAMRIKIKSYFLPKDKEVAHKCNNSTCLNPLHLELSTKEENASDRIEAGTSGHGEKGSNASITNALARQIKFSKGNGTKAARAKRFKVSESLVKSIDRGSAWNWLGPTKEKDNYYKKSADRKYEQAKQNHHVLIQSDFPTALQNLRRNINEVKYEQSSCCWIWKLKPTKSGYGRIKFKGRKYYSHVLSWLCHNEEKELEHGKVIRHKCKQKLCCNFEHVEKGTHAQNAGEDRDRDGTKLVGEKNPMSTMTDNVRKQIIESYGKGTAKERAAQFGVSHSSVSNIDHSQRKRKHKAIENATTSKKYKNLKNADEEKFNSTDFDEEIAKSQNTTNDNKNGNEEKEFHEKTKSAKKVKGKVIIKIVNDTAKYELKEINISSC